MKTLREMNYIGSGWIIERTVPAGVRLGIGIAPTNGKRSAPTIFIEVGFYDGDLLVFDTEHEATDHIVEHGVSYKGRQTSYLAVERDLKTGFDCDCPSAMPMESDSCLEAAAMLLTKDRPDSASAAVLVEAAKVRAYQERTGSINRISGAILNEGLLILGQWMVQRFSPTGLEDLPVDLPIPPETQE